MFKEAPKAWTTAHAKLIRPQAVVIQDSWGSLGYSPGSALVGHSYFTKRNEFEPGGDLTLKDVSQISEG